MSYCESSGFFYHRSQGSLQEIFLLIGDTLRKKMVNKVNYSPVFSILVDEVTDISVKCQMVVFIQYLDDFGSPVVNFLESRDVLSNSVSADSATLHQVLKDCIKDINGSKLCGLVTDGASTMTGKKNGLAARIKKEHRTVVSVHCICHRLALACTDSNKDCKFVADTSDILRYLWEFFEDSPKRTATLVRVQMEMAKCNEQLPKTSRISIVHKVKKACSTRWLSFNAAVQGCYDDFPAIMQCLSLLEKDVVATGLLKKMKNVRFVTSIFILKEILPILAKLSKTFQAGTINYACIQPCIQEAKDALRDSSLTEKVKTAIVKETKGNERLGFLELTPTEAQLKEATGKMAKYVEALRNNLDERFDEAAPLLAAFSVFDPYLLPDKIEPAFKHYGDEKIDDLGSHFLAGDEEAKNELSAEWMSYKYHILRLKKNVLSSQEKKTTDVVLKILMNLRNPSDKGYIFPRLSHMAAIILSLLVSNAWPERGASAVKRIKTRLRSTLKDNMLSGLLQVSINGPPVKEATELINKCVDNWYKAKPRRKLKGLAKDKVVTIAPAEVMETADTGVQADFNENDEEEMGRVRTKMSHILKLLHLTGFQDDADYDSEEDDNESEDSDEFDYDNVTL
ncbi:zinc finger protein 862-like [Mytilus californianus]|uniref:zinc finger protein 862-like n=1 Tax=Mytilus californianus TaxID=6549 RepID=UPI002246655F|nr:zinc finger protein 862-like [Mytilus californianus]